MEGPQGGSRDCCPRKTALGQGVERRIQQRRRVGEAHPAQSPRSRHAVVDAQTKIVEDAREGDRRAKDGLLDPWVADPPPPALCRSRSACRRDGASRFFQLSCW